MSRKDDHTDTSVTGIGLENLEELNQAALVADVDALETMRDPAQIKAKANEMLGKLGGAAPESAVEDAPAEE